MYNVYIYTEREIAIRRIIQNKGSKAEVITSKVSYTLEYSTFVWPEDEGAWGIILGIW